MPGDWYLCRQKLLGEEMKRKDYLKLFVQFARKNRIGFDVYAMGSVRCLYIVSGRRIVSPTLNKLGSKAAYDQLLKAFREAQDE